MLNFYRRFVPHAAAMLLPLYELVNVKGDEFEAAWTTRHDEHFQCSKDALATATYLAHPSATAETCINTDASDTAVGAVLQQRLNGVWTPISFFSRKLHAAETKYSTFDKELLAMYLAVKKLLHRGTTGNVVYRPLAAYFCLQKHFGQVVASSATTSVSFPSSPPTFVTFQAPTM